MRYSNSELFDVPDSQYQSWLDDSWTPREFFLHCEVVLRCLVHDSVYREDWNSQEQKELRAYRTDAIEFYKQKRGIK
jgi:hypothetical protein